MYKGCPPSTRRLWLGRTGKESDRGNGRPVANLRSCNGVMLPGGSRGFCQDSTQLRGDPIRRLNLGITSIAIPEGA